LAHCGVSVFGQLSQPLIRTGKGKFSGRQHKFNGFLDALNKPVRAKAFRRPEQSE
jgi:hypothetical protein